MKKCSFSLPARHVAQRLKVLLDVDAVRFIGNVVAKQELGFVRHAVVNAARDECIIAA